MKKFLKVLGFTCLGITIILYLAFLFILPKVIDISPYKAEVQKIIKEQANLDLEYSDAKLITTPALRIGIKANNIKVLLPDNSLLFSSDSIKASASIPNLLFLRLKISELEVENPLINIEILENGEDYKIVKSIEDMLNAKKEATFGEKPALDENGSGFDMSLIKIIIPNVKLNNYKILVTDLATKHYLDLHGEQLTFGWFNRERIKVKTTAELYSDTNKNITANLDVNTFLPEPAPELDSEDDPAEKIDVYFVNPVTVYQNYDLKANIDSKIKINKNKSGKITSFGYINIDNITMKLSELKLPESYIRLKTFGTNVDIDTNIHPMQDENINIAGKINYGKNKNADLTIKSDEIKFANLLEISKAFLDSLQIPNELQQYIAEGSALADCNIKTNFKKLKSSGYIKIKDGGLSVRDAGKMLSDANLNLIFENNALDVKDSALFINNSKVNIDGIIDEKSYTDIKITTEKLPLAQLFEAFAPKEIREEYLFKSGEVSSHITINGLMKESVSKIDMTLYDFNFLDKKNSFNIKNKKFDTSFVYEAKTENLTGEMNNNGFEFILPKTASVISLPNIKVNVKDKNIEIGQNIIKFNDKSTLVYSGSIVNYEKPKDINFTLQGGVDTNDLIKFIGQELKPYFHSSGSIPVNLTFNGNSAKQTLFVEALADDKNFITPIDFTKLNNLKTTLQATIDFKPKRIKIKDTGLYTRAYITDEEGKEVKILNKFLGVDGTIENSTINLLKIDIPKDIAARIFVFPQSQLVLNGSKVYLYGKVNEPLFKGDLRISDISIPEILTSTDKIDLNFKESDLNFDLGNIQMSGSDLKIKGKYPLVSDSVSNIYDLNINSEFINVDDLTVVSQKLMSYLPQSSSSSSGTSADIPVWVHNGNIDLNRIKTGNIELSNTKSDLSIYKNILSLKGLSTDIFKGRVDGDIAVNLLSLMINTDLRGRRIDVEKALLDSANMKDSLSGTMDFTAKLGINGAASTPEAQMKGIEGDVDFKIRDGQFGPFGKLENLIIAENIRESQFFQTALGGIIESIATIDTTHFSEVNGHVFLKDGICYIDPITSLGNVMNLHILGNFDIVKNYADMKVRVKITSILSNLLGPLNAINPVNLVNSAASMNVVTAKAFSLFCETVPEEEMDILPKFSNDYVDSSATKFQLGVRGDAAKPLTLIKSFKWLATQMQFAKAKEFADSLPEPTEDSTATTIEEAIEEANRIEAEKKTLKYKVKHIFHKKDKK